MGPAKAVDREFIYIVGRAAGRMVGRTGGRSVGRTVGRSDGRSDGWLFLSFPLSLILSFCFFLFSLLKTESCANRKFR